jgi:hypothetical protein
MLIVSGNQQGGQTFMSGQDLFQQGVAAIRDEKLPHTGPTP